MAREQQAILSNMELRAACLMFRCLACASHGEWPGAGAKCTGDCRKDEPAHGAGTYQNIAVVGVVCGQLQVLQSVSTSNSDVPLLPAPLLSFRQGGFRLDTYIVVDEESCVTPFFHASWRWLASVNNTLQHLLDDLEPEWFPAFTTRKAVVSPSCGIILEQPRTSLNPLPFRAKAQADLIKTEVKFRSLCLHL